MKEEREADRILSELIQASPHGTFVLHYLVDLVGDLVTGVLLSQIIYWYRGGKLRIERAGRPWLAKRREDWWNECRIRPKQFDRAIDILREKGLVETEVHRFGGFPTLHIWLNLAALSEGVKTLFPKGEERDSRKGNNVIPERGISLTETTNRDYVQISTTTGNPMVDALFLLPYWKPDPEGDVLWLAEFSLEFPDFSLQHIKECRDFHDGRRARHKGDWKNRLRNWMKIDTQRKGKHEQRTKTDPRHLISNAEELARTWEQ